MLDTRSLASHGPVIPVIVVQRLEQAVPLARALVEGGVKVLEVTLRTPVALAAIEAIARAVAASGAFSIAGGGDTLAAIAKYGIERQVSYISTGGGAFLEVLEGETLPAFEILARRAAGGGTKPR